MDKTIKFRASDEEKTIIATVARELGGTGSAAIRYMIRTHARMHLTVNQAAALVAEDEAQDAREMVR